MTVEMKGSVPVRLITPARSVERGASIQSRVFRPEGPVSQRDMRMTRPVWTANRAVEQQKPRVTTFDATRKEKLSFTSQKQENVLFTAKSWKQADKVPQTKKELWSAPTATFKAAKEQSKDLTVKNPLEYFGTRPKNTEKYPSPILPPAVEQMRKYLSQQPEMPVRPDAKPASNPNIQQAEKVRRLMKEVGFAPAEVQRIVHAAVQKTTKQEYAPQRYVDNKETIKSASQTQVIQHEQSKELKRSWKQELVMKVRLLMKERMKHKQQHEKWVYEVDTKANKERVKLAIFAAKRAQARGENLHGETIAKYMPIEQTPTIKSAIIRNIPHKEDGSYKEVVEKLRFIGNVKHVTEVAKKAKEITQWIPAVRIAKQPTSEPVTKEDVERVVNDKAALLSLAKTALK